MSDKYNKEDMIQENRKDKESNHSDDQLPENYLEGTLRMKGLIFKGVIAVCIITGFIFLVLGLTNRKKSSTTSASSAHPAAQQQETADEAEENEEIQDDIVDDDESSEEAVSSESVVLTIFAPASLKEILTDIFDLYEEVHPEVSFNLHIDSTGYLMADLKEGAYCDIVISVPDYRLDQIDGSSDNNSEGYDLILKGSRKKLLSDMIFLCVPEYSQNSIQSFQDLADGIESNSITCGMVANRGISIEDILSYYGVDETNDAIEYFTDANEVADAINSGLIDAAVLYGTDSHTAGLADTEVDNVTRSMTENFVLDYSIAILNTSDNIDASQTFIDYLFDDYYASDIILEAGFAIFAGEQ